MRYAVIVIGLILSSTFSFGAEPIAPILKIDWKEGPEYPMGIQDSAFAMLDGVIVSAGGFSRHPKDIVAKYPDAFEGQPLVGSSPSGFTSLTFTFDPRHPDAGWTRIENIPGPARQAAATVVVGHDLYAVGGFSYTDPLVYRDMYRLRREGDAWKWTKLSPRLPWPICEAGVVAIGDKIYLVGGADIYASPGQKETDFNSEAGRTGEPVGRALLMLDTKNVDAGWKRLADIPGVPRFDACAAAAGGKIYALGGVHRGTKDGTSRYYNVTESWVYDPVKNEWSRLPDMPMGGNRRAVTFADRYVVLIGGYKCEWAWNSDGSTTNVYTPAEKQMKMIEHFEDTVLVFDTQTQQVGSADRLLDPTSYPMATIEGETVYTLGGEGGRRLWHPATFQIGRIKSKTP
jgi:N-acetylneuraminic acid mutarotase